MNEYIILGNAKIVFLIVDSNYKATKGNQFELISIDGQNKTGLYTEEEEYGDIHFFRDIYTLEENQNEKMADALPTIIKNELYNINTIDDLSFFDLHDTFFVKNSYNNSISYQFNVPFRFHQIKTSPGIKRTELIIGGECKLRFYYDTEGNITKKQMNIDITDYHNNKFLFTNDIPTINTVEDLDYISQQEIERSCINTDNQGIVITNSTQCTTYAELNGSFFYNLVPYFIAEKGDVSLKVENTVNGLQKYDASNNRDLIYKIIIKNMGSTSAEDNEITAYLPNEIIIKENTISNQGNYVKENNTIKWNIGHIEVEENVELTYQATVSKNINNRELTVNTVMKSQKMDYEIISNNTVVTLEKELMELVNPSTGNTISKIYLTLNIFVLISVITVIVYIIKKKLIK